MHSEDLTDPIDIAEATEPVQLSKPVFQTSPGHLRAVAHLYGIDTVPLREARILELGCGTGGNLLPHALGYPSSVVVGVDVDSESVAYGQQVIAELGVQNQQLFAVGLDVLLGIEDLGEFDYILVHGSYALVDADTRLALMHFCRKHLSPLGLACFGYPTYPGQKSHDVLRDAVQLHSGLASTESDRLSSAKAMLTFMAHGLDARNPMAANVRKQAVLAERKTDLAVALEFLEGFGQPCYFVEFNDLAQQAGFVYVGDAEPHTELAGSYPSNVRNLYQIINPEGNKVLGQQYLDFASGRASRMSLLTHASRAADVTAFPQLKRLRDLRWAGSFKRVVTDNGTVSNGHTDAAGEELGTDDRTSLRILDVLGSAWPFSLDFDTLTYNVRSPAASLRPDDDPQATVANALGALFTQGRGLLRPSLEESPYDLSPALQLGAVPGLVLLTGDRAADMPYRMAILNLWSDAVVVALDPVERAMLPHFDGKRDLASQVATLRALLEPGETSGDERKAANLRARKALSKLVDKLRRHGLLVGSSAAWADYYRQSVAAHIDEPMVAVGYADALMMATFPPGQGGLAASASSVAAQRAAAAKPVPALTAALRHTQHLVDTRKNVEAEQAARQLVLDFPQSARAWQKLNHVLLHLEKIAEVLEPALHALHLSPADPMQYFDLGAALRRQRKLWHAEYFMEKVLRVTPDNGVAWDHLGCFYEQRKAMRDAQLCHERAASLEPTNASVLCNLATVYSYQSHLGLAMEYYERAVARAPSAFHIHSNYLFTSIHALEVDARTLFERHREFGKKVEERAQRSKWKADFSSVDRTPNRKLRVGFVSGDLRFHAVTNFLEPYWNDLDLRKFSLYGYSACKSQDEVSARLKKRASGWCEVAEMDDETLARRIRADEIDILFDLSGHTAMNRLPMFAFKPAPIQVTWIGYPATTGLEAMDYKLVSAFYAKPGVMDDQFTEKLVYIAGKPLFEPSPLSPAVNALPALSTGVFTFASFNRPQKLSDEVLSAWVEILQAAPNSRLMMANMTDNRVVEDMRSRLLSLGANSDQLVFKLRHDIAGYLKQHAEIDLILDAFPYPGGTTTNHGLWMGVPTLTLAGDTMVSRQGVPMLLQFGLDDFVAYSVKEYVERAVALAGNLESLAKIRSQLRATMNATVVGNDKTVAAFEKVLTRIWENWCDGKPATSLSINASAD